MTAEVTDWSDYLKCSVCFAERGKPCYWMSTGGPEALPPVFMDEPHHGRKLSAEARGRA